MNEANNMSTSNEKALRLALEALQWFTAAEPWDEPDISKAIKALEAALEAHKALASEQEQRNVSEQLGEPVAYTNGKEVILAKHWTADYPPEGWEPLDYTTPYSWQQRIAERKPLTEQEFEKLHYEAKGYVVTGLMDIVRIVEAAHGITKENT